MGYSVKSRERERERHTRKEKERLTHRKIFGWLFVVVIPANNLWCAKGQIHEYCSTGCLSSRHKVCRRVRQQKTQYKKLAAMKKNVKQKD